MSRREYDDYDRARSGGNVQYVPAGAPPGQYHPQSPPPSRQYDDHRQGSGPAPSYGPPGGFPESPPKDRGYPPASYQYPTAVMPQAPIPPGSDYRSDTPPSATIVSGRRPPSPGVRFAEPVREYAAPKTPVYPSGAPRGPPTDPRRSAGKEEWDRVYQRELAEHQQISKDRDHPTSRGIQDHDGPRDRGLDVNLNTKKVSGSLSVGRDRTKSHRKDKRDHDLAWSSGSESSSEDDTRRHPAQSGRRDDRRRDSSRHDTRPKYDDTHYGDPRRSSGALQTTEHRRTASHSYDDPRRSSGNIVVVDQHRRSSGYDDPRRSGGNLVRYERDDDYYRDDHHRDDHRDYHITGDDIAGVRYVQRPRSPSQSTHSGRPGSSTYLVESTSGRSRADSVGRRHPSVSAINTDMARMSVDTYRPSYYDLSPMPSPTIGARDRDRGFNFDIGGAFSLGSSLGGASAGYSASASAGHSHGGSSQTVKPQYSRRHSHESKYDPSDHAQIMYKALKGKTADVASINKLLPLLSGYQVIALRAEYKRVHPLGNVNMAKHIKAQLSGKIQLAAYVTSLGPFESETYWSILSNQKPNFRHALMIEALLGRENDDILDIKESYRDSKNDNSLEKALSKELSADKATGDKFKELVMIQLDAKGMDEWDYVYLEKVRDDVEILHEALSRDKVDSIVVGRIVILRSTTHLREMMRLYKKLYEQDLARLIAQKITGLVGEALLHILNGVLNKPARDARLLEESMKGVGTRDELLVARLVRIHWDPDHMAAVKEAYKAKYNLSLKERIQAECSGSYQEYLLTMISVDTHTTAVIKH